MSDKHLRRLHILGGHVAAPSSDPAPGPDGRVSFGVEAAQSTRIAAANVGASTSYASATGRPSSYARVHGEVSNAPAQWVAVPSVHKETLQEVKYEKAANEGIVKVRLNFRGRTDLRERGVGGSILSLGELPLLS